jgi:hypothetical protein
VTPTNPAQIQNHDGSRASDEEDILDCIGKKWRIFYLGCMRHKHFDWKIFQCTFLSSLFNDDSDRIHQAQDGPPEAWRKASSWQGLTGNLPWNTT